MNTEELKKYCIDNHRKMWHWLADNPDKEKKDWPGWENHNDNDFSKENDNYCFLCGYISQMYDEDCYDCPLDWCVTDMCMYTYPESYYELYLAAPTLKIKAKYAKIIANLSEKNNTEERLIIE